MAGVLGGKGSSFEARIGIREFWRACLPDSLTLSLEDYGGESP
jgi:hypothetical protein